MNLKKILIEQINKINYWPKIPEDEKYKVFYKDLEKIYNKEMKKAKYIGSLPMNNCYKNAEIMRKKGYDVYNGYLYIGDAGDKEKGYLYAHSWNGKNNQVYEFTKILANGSISEWYWKRYFGFKVL